MEDLTQLWQKYLLSATLQVYYPTIANITLRIGYGAYV